MVNLGPDRDEAFRRYHELMATVPKTREAIEEKLASDAVLVIIERFLEWCEKHRPDSYVWYRQRLKQFALSIPRLLRVAEFKPFHVQQWVDGHGEWSDGHKRGSTVAVQRAFRWAEKMGHIAQSPVRHVDKPQQGKRERFISPAEYAMLLERYPDSFGELLRMAWHFGARPQESVRIEARHVDLPNRRVTLPPGEAKGKKRWRVIYLNDRALRLVTERAAACPEGPIFRNADGEPWTAMAVNCRFNRLQEHLGRGRLDQEGFETDPEEVCKLAATLPGTRREKGRTVEKNEKGLLREARKKLRNPAARKRGEKLCLYAFRHTFSQRLLLAGVDSLTVSTLLGHVDGTMLTRVYQHLQQSNEHLLKALNQADVKSQDA